jgi:hypothetical protein
MLVMTEKPPIPPSIWARVVAFLKAGATGQVVLHIHEGRVSKASISETVGPSAVE